MAMGIAQRRTFDEISRSLQEFAQSDDMLLTPDLMRRYSGNWVAVYQGRVLAVSKELNAIREQLDREGVTSSTVAIRFIGEGGMAAA